MGYGGPEVACGAVGGWRQRALVLAGEDRGQRLTAALTDGLGHDDAPDGRAGDACTARPAQGRRGGPGWRERGPIAVAPAVPMEFIRLRLLVSQQSQLEVVES